MNKTPFQSQHEPAPFDVAIVGGGPAGLAAALALGRACRRVVMFDAGPPRNAAASHIYNFVTRDGTPPQEFRRLGREQLRPYSGVEVRDEAVRAIGGERDAFTLEATSGTVRARRVILCAGMVDEMVELPGFKDAWGHSIYQCPYCHGWEARGKRWGYLALDLLGLQHGFAAMLRGWTEDVVVFKAAHLEVPPEVVEGLERRGIEFKPQHVAELLVQGSQLTHVVLADGERVRCDVLFAHPSQHQAKVVEALGLELGPTGYVQVDLMTRQTSRPGIYVAGDLTTQAQGAIFAAASGTQAGAMAHHDLCLAMA